MGRKSSQKVTKSEKVALEKNSKWMSQNEQIKIQKIVLNQLAKVTGLNKLFRLLMHSKAIPDVH